MRLSNKLTFSLVCIILLLAFVAVPVMAHPVVDDATADPVTYISGHAPTNDAHSVVKSVTLKGDAVDGYVDGDSFLVDVAFEAANATNKIIVPASALTTGNISAAGFTVVEVLKKSNTLYEARLRRSNASDGAPITITTDVGYTQPNADANGDGNPDTGAAADRANPDKAVVIYDETSPDIHDGKDNSDPNSPDLNETAPTAQPVGGNLAPLPGNGWSDPFRLVFKITPDASNDLSTLGFTAAPAHLMFGSPGGTGVANEYAVDVTYKNVTVAADTEVTITIEVSDKAGNKSTTTVAVTLAKRTATTDPTDPTDPPTTDPTSPANIFKFTAPPGYSILVRNKSAVITETDGVRNPPIGQSFHKILDDLTNTRVIEDTNIIEWNKMPNLKALFDRTAAGGGGALILRKAAGDAAAPGVGTVGISEIMWAIDASYIGQTKARDSQWIEIHNLHATAKKVVIYAQTGAQFTNKDKVVVNTQAGDQIHGSPSAMVVDVITNYFNNGDRGTAGWDLPGSNGSSTTGINFVSTERKGTFDIDRVNKDGKKTGLYRSQSSPDGRRSDSWEAADVRYERLSTDKPQSATTGVPATYDFIGTPGRPSSYTTATHIVKDKTTNVPASPIVINEVSNRDSVYNQYEWIELRNVSGAEVNLNNYQISILTAVDSDKPFIYLSNNNNAKIPANGVLVLTDSDPYGDPEHPLAVGWNVDKSAENQIPGLKRIGITATSLNGRYKVVKFGQDNTDYSEGLPDDGNFILVVRKADNHESDHAHADKGRAELGAADLGKITDIAGYVSGLSKSQYSNVVSSTKLWPLKEQQNSPASDKNKLSVNIVHSRKHLIQGGLAGAGTTHGDKKEGQVAYEHVGYTGIGYKRQAADSPVHGGSPGYHEIEKDHGIKKDTAHDDDGGIRVYISEIMLSQGSGRNANLPQYIELYNASDYAVDLSGGEGVGWTLVIENEVKGDNVEIINSIRTINFRSKGNVKVINPKQTVLIVSGSARSFGSDTLPSSIVFPDTRVFNVYKELKGHFEMTTRSAQMINPEAFNIKLIDGGKKVGGVVVYTTSDEIGNLDGNPRTNDKSKWQYPGCITKDGSRTSLIRVFDDNIARPAHNIEKSDVLPLGAKKMDDTVDLAKRSIPAEYAWIRTSQADFGGLFVRHTWYGHESDFGTPANRAGQILPVNLSHFRPELENGEVVIRWTTESELDNAGFNILRSDTRNGEYKQVNTEMIQGNGTTGERNTYKWVDASAKPGVVYYYQIEDVSFAGERQTLQTTKLKGLISAVGKATTTWGDIKEVQ